MPTASNRNVAQLRRSCVTRAALAALVEAADALPGLGPLLAGAGTFYQELRRIPRDLPTEARDLVRAMPRTSAPSWRGKPHALPGRP